MENVIRDHFIYHSATPLIFPINLGMKITRWEGGMSRYVVDCLFYNPSNTITYKYTISNIFHPYERITLSSKKIEFVLNEQESGRNTLTTPQGSKIWGRNGNLVEEIIIYNEACITREKIVRYRNGGPPTIIIHYYTFLYDLKDHLEKEGYLPFSLSDDEKRNIEEISNGNLDSVTPDHGTFFYVDDNGKVNVISINPNRIITLSEDKRTFVKLIREVPDKLKEDAENLRKDPLNYLPKHIPSLYCL